MKGSLPLTPAPPQSENKQDATWQRYPNQQMTKHREPRGSTEKMTTSPWKSMEVHGNAYPKQNAAGVTDRAAQRSRHPNKPTRKVPIDSQSSWGQNAQVTDHWIYIRHMRIIADSMHGLFNAQAIFVPCYIQSYTIMITLMTHDISYRIPYFHHIFTGQRPRQDLPASYLMNLSLDLVHGYISCAHLSS